MSGESRDGGGAWLGNPGPIVMVVLLVAGTLVKTVPPLESARPADPERLKSVRMGVQDVEARLWQDPLAAIEGEAAGKNGPTTGREPPEPGNEHEKKQEDDAHSSIAIRNSIESWVKQGNNVSVLAVSVFVDSYNASAEWRRRARVAIMSALNSEGYVPEIPDSMGYYRSSFPGKAGVASVELLVPYEWFHKSEKSKSAASSVLLLWLNEEKFASNPYDKLITLFGEIKPADDQFLNVKLIGPAGSSALVNLISDTPHGNCRSFRSLDEVLRRSMEWHCIALHPSLGGMTLADNEYRDTLRASEQGDGQYFRTFHRPFRNISSEAKVLDDLSEKVYFPRFADVNLSIFSPTATISNCDIYTSAKKTPKLSRWNCFMHTETAFDLSNMSRLSIVRTIVTDDVLSATLLWELWQRGVNRSHSWPMKEGKTNQDKFNQNNSTSDKNRECDDGVVLIHEWDTAYARSLAQTFTEGFREFCGDGTGVSPPVRSFAYLRGMDGISSNTEKPETKTSAKRQNEVENNDLKKLRKQLEEAPPEHAEGRNQYDYLRRLAQQIERLDEDPDFAKNGVKAIGILGSDVYDKLLILMGLRPGFKDKVFFTTDLDARYLHADQQQWARNLVVASSFGVALNPALQESALPFRDTYQTAIYLAALMALKQKQDEEIKGSDRQVGVNGWLRPLTFEIGRTQAVPLASPSVEDLARWIDLKNPRGVVESRENRLPSCTEEPLLKCEVHPSWYSPLTYTHPLMVALFLVAGILLLVLASRSVQKTFINAFTSQDDTKGNPATRLIIWVSFGTGAIWAIVELTRTQLNRSLESGIGEPFLWLEGVSVWPSITIRFIGVISMLMLIVAFIYRLKGDKDQISDYVGCTATEKATLSGGCWNRTLDRSCRARWLRGPNVNLLAYDAKGSSIVRTPVEKVETAVLWQNYLRATSCGEMLPWIFLSTLGVMFFTSLVFMFTGPPSFPHRGDLVFFLNIALVLVNVFLLWMVTFWASYEARACTRLIDALNSKPLLRLWRVPQEDSIEAKLDVPPDDLADYRDFQLVSLATQRTHLLIYLSFVSIFFLVVARSDFFDALNFPLGPVLVIMLSLAYAVYAEMTLRRCAIKARTQAIEDYEEVLCLQTGTENSAISKTFGTLRDGKTGGSDTDRDGKQSETKPRINKDQIRFLVKRIQDSNRGAFASLMEQPLLRAVLLPFGGFGGVQLIQYFLDFTSG